MTQRRVRPTDATLRDVFLETARAQLGVAGRAGTRESYFNTRAGYPDSPWSGAFVDVVAREAQVTDRVPRCVYPPVALSWFHRRGRLHLAGAQEGDVAFLLSAAPGGSRFEIPAVGIVTQVLSSETFRVLVGDHPQPGATNVRVVTERDYTVWDVAGLGRPDWRLAPRVARPVATPPEQLTVSVAAIRAAATHPRRTQPVRTQDMVRLVQDALGSGNPAVLLPPLRGAVDGMWCLRTQRAWQLWLRTNGLVHTDAEALPDEDSLEELSRRSGTFAVLP